MNIKIGPHREHKYTMALAYAGLPPEGRGTEYVEWRKKAARVVCSNFWFWDKDKGSGRRSVKLRMFENWVKENSNVDHGSEDHVARQG